MEHRIIDQQLDLLRDKLLLLGGTTEAALQRAMRSLTERDSKLAKQVLDDDKIIDQMELEIDRFSVEILALQQPAAHDLRFVISVAKITPIEKPKQLKPRIAGLGKGTMWMSDDFDDELPDEFWGFDKEL